MNERQSLPIVGMEQRDVLQVPRVSWLPHHHQIGTVIMTKVGTVLGHHHLAHLEEGEQVTVEAIQTLLQRRRLLLPRRGARKNWPLSELRSRNCLQSMVE